MSDVPHFQSGPEDSLVAARRRQRLDGIVHRPNPVAMIVRVTSLLLLLAILYVGVHDFDLWS